MRFSNILTSIRESFQSRQYAGSVNYRAATTATTAVEVFLDGQVGRRLVPATDSTTLLNCYGVCHTVAGASTFTQRRVLVRCSALGVLSFVDLDATTVGLNDVEIASSVATASGATVLTVPIIPGTAVAGSFVFSLVALTSTSPAYIAATYTPAVATATFLEVKVDFIECGPRG